MATLKNLFMPSTDRLKKKFHFSFDSQAFPYY